MSSALLAAQKLSRLSFVMQAATSKSGKTDLWFADRLGCSREQFNKAKNGRGYLTVPQTVAWGVLVGVDVQAVMGVNTGSQRVETAE